jgi:leader peptidase (prepilin peptidase)/N-methyltransferase
VIWLYAGVGVLVGAGIGYAAAKAMRPVPISLGALLGGAGGIAVATSHYMPGWILLAVMLVWLWIGFVDVAEQIVPDRLSFAAAAISAAGLLGATEISGNWVRLGQTVAIAGVVVAGAALWSIFGSLGWGDVKLSVSLGLILGWQGWIATAAGAAAAVLIAGLWAGVTAARKRSWKGHFPLAPSWILGAFGAAITLTGGL